MVAYSFQRQFIDHILSTRKTQTIRAKRKRGHATPGDKLQLYYAMRTKHCLLIGTALCCGVSTVTLDFENEVVTDCHLYGEHALTERYESRNRLDEFAAMDGFENWTAMREFWIEQHDNPRMFVGVLIEWTAFEDAKQI